MTPRTHAKGAGPPVTPFVIAAAQTRVFFEWMRRADAAPTDTVLWLEKGRVRAIGEPHSTVKAYLDWAKEQADAT